MDGNDIMLLFQIAVGICMLYAAIIGKGKVYENKHTIQGKETEYRNTIRMLCIVGGPLALVSAALGYTKWEIPSYLLLVALFAYVVYIAVRVRKLINP